MHWVTPDLIQHTQCCHSLTMSNVTLKHTPRAPVRNCRNHWLQGPITPVVQGVYWQLSTRLQNSIPKRAWQNQKAFPKKRSIMEHSPELPQDRKSSRRWKLSKYASQRSSWNQMSFLIWQGHQILSVCI